MFRKGFLHGVVLVVLTASITHISRLAFPSYLPYAAISTYLLLIFSIFWLGKRLRLNIWRELVAGNKSMLGSSIRYASGLGLPIASYKFYAIALPVILTQNSHQAISLLGYLGVAIVSTTLTVSTMLTIGSWFHKTST